jgi:hypothetical protein
MNACPEIDRLLEDPHVLAAHLDGCEACRGVGALVDLRHERIAGADDACERAELSIALLHERLLTELERVALTQHLEACSACNETAARVLSLPAYDAKPLLVAESRHWRRAAIGLGVTTLVASAAALALFLARPRTETTVAAVPERVQIIERRAEPGGAGAVVSPVIPTPEPPPEPPRAITPPPKIDFPAPPFVGSQTNPRSPPPNDDVMDPWGDTGFLSVVCNPTCDSVSVKGKKLGPSPVVRAVVPVGSQTVSGRRGRHSKATVVEIKKGETTTVRLHMNVDLGF